MRKEESVITYKAIVYIFKQWLSYDFISEEEYAAIETNAAQDCGLTLGSIYREIA